MDGGGERGRHDRGREGAAQTEKWERIGQMERTREHRTREQEREVRGRGPLIAPARWTRDG